MAIKKCNCPDKFMDEKYGPGMRVCNETKDGGTRCTKCSTKHMSKGDNKKTK